MTPDRQRAYALWTRFVAGEPLAPEEEEELLAALSADPSLGEEADKDEQLDGLLRVLGRSGRDERIFVREFVDRAAADRDRDRFARQVERRLIEEKRPVRRLPRRSSRRTGVPSGAPLLVALGTAAAVLFGILLFLAAGSTGPRPGEYSSAGKTRREAPPPVPSPSPRHVTRPEVPSVKVPVTPPTPVPRDPGKPSPPLVPVPKDAEKKRGAEVEMRREVERPRKEEQRKPTVPRKPAPKPTVVATASLEFVRGNVVVVTPRGSLPARAGLAIGAGQGLKTTGPGSRAILRFHDGTGLKIEPDSVVEDIAMQSSQENVGKFVRVTRGAVVAHVKPQPADRPLVIATPRAEARVLGTTLRIHVGSDSTRLDVTEGKVRFLRKRDGRSIEVTASHFAVAAPRAPLREALIFDGSAPHVVELEDFGNASEARFATKRVKRLYLESGGDMLAAPGVGTEVAGDAILPRGDWFVWVRFRDDQADRDGGLAGFEVRVNGALLGSASTTGKGKQWLWKRFAFRTPGRTRIAIRSTYPGEEAPDATLYDLVNRWDKMILTRDGSYVPNP